MSIRDRLFLLGASLLGAYQVVAGVEGLVPLAVTCYTVGFGVLIVAGLLMIVMGFETLDSPLVVILSTLIPLSLSSGLVAEYFPDYARGYLAFAIAGFLVVAASRFWLRGSFAAVSVIVVHGVAGLLIFFLPLVYVLDGLESPGFVLVGIGGGLSGLLGLLLSFLKTGRPLFPRQTALRMIPPVLLLTAFVFVAGFALR